MLELFPAVALALAAAALAVSGVMWLKFDPRKLFERMKELEAQQPRYHQELAAWTVATDRMLEECGIKLAKAHQRSGGRPKRPPDNGPTPPAAAPDRKTMLSQIGAELRARGAIQ